MLGVNAWAEVPPGLVSWWKGEGNALDSAGTNNGTLVGNTTYGVGMVGQAFVFDGNGDGVLVGNPPCLQLQTFTVEMWIKRSSVSLSSLEGWNSANIFGYGWDGYCLGMHDDGTVYLTKNGVDAVDGGMITDTNWHHFAVSYTPGTAVIYVDGAPSGPLAYNQTFIFGTSVAIGTADQVGSSFYGTIDEVSVYNRVLTSSEIHSIYSLGSAGKSTAPTVPSILVQPASVSVLAGSNATFSVTASGTQPLAYQWYFNATNVLAGATNATLALSNVTSNNVGVYSVIVTNAFGTTKSSNAVLTIVYPVAVPSGLVSWWKGEGNALDSAGENNGTLVGNASYGVGMVGGGFVFSGNGGAVTIGNPANLQLQTFTVETWIKRSSTTLATVDNVYHSGNIFGYGGNGYTLGMNNDGSVYLTQNGVDEVDGGYVTNTSWHHFAVSYTPGTAVIYVDGVSSGPISYDRTFLFTSDVEIGRADGIWPCFYGAIDEVSVYNRVLSDAEIQYIYSLGSAGKSSAPTAPSILVQPASVSVLAGSNATFSVTASGTQPLAYQWYFNATNVLAVATNATLVLSNVTSNNAGVYSVIVSNALGTTNSSNAVLSVVNPVAAPSGLVGWWKGDGNAADSAGTNDGTLVGNVSYGTGMVGQGFVFDGNGDEVLIGNPARLRLQTFTIEMWLKRSSATAASTDGSSAANLFGYGTFGYVVGVKDGGSLFLSLNGVDSVSGGSVADTNWHHVAVTFGAATACFYVDGALAGSSSYNRGFVFSTKVAIGKSDGGSACFYGSIDEVSVYNRVLTAAEVQSVYGARQVGKIMSPVIASQPVSLAATNGSKAAFTVVAKGTLPFTYQWYFNGTNLLAGATNATLSINGVSVSNAGLYSVVVSNFAGGVISSNAVLSIVYPVSITRQPQSVSGLEGSSISLSVEVSGTAPFFYQWQRYGTNLPGATNSSLVFNNFAPSQAGSYVVVVSNSVTSATSSLAQVSLIAPVIHVPDIAAASATLLTVPVYLDAIGVENAAQFSLSFDPSLLQFVSVAAGNNGVGLDVNTSLLSSGKLGCLAALSLGSAFPAGTQTLALVTFYVAPITNSQTTSIVFGDSPTPRKLVNVYARAFTTTYQPNTVTISLSQYEGDVSPSGGDSLLDIADWVKVGRIVAGLDAISNPSEFQKVDCAPRGTLGDGIISVADWVQAGRYAAGLDLVQAAGGPSNAVSISLRSQTLASGTARQLALVATETNSGLTVAAQLAAQGGENALAFNVKFDPAIARFVSAAAAQNGSFLVVNTNQINAGVLGVVFALPTGVELSAGLRTIANLSFAAVNSYQSSAITFADSPLHVELANANADVLPLTILTTPVIRTPILSLPALTIESSSTNVLISWPVSAAGFTLQVSDSLDASWTTVDSTPVANDSEVVVTIPVAGEQKFYRLKQDQGGN